MVSLFGLLAGNGLILTIFVLGILALPNSPDMRKLMSRLPVIGYFIKKSDAARQVLLRRVHNNSYQLITVILRYSIKALIRWTGLGVAVLLAYDVANFMTIQEVLTTKAIMLTAALALACPMLGLIQWVFWLRKLLHDLRRYDSEARKLSRYTKPKPDAPRPALQQEIPGPSSDQ